MKANELMIGDWVNLKNGKVLQPVQITVIGHPTLDRNDIGTSICLGLSDEYPTCVFRLNQIEPISLTPEILEKNGFENIGDDTYQLEEKPYWFWIDFFNRQYGCEYDTSTYEYEDDEHRLKLYGIPSVHGLQHALRLCGILKEIEL